MRESQNEQYQTIQEWNAALVLFHDDIQDLDEKVKAIKYKNFGLQGEIYAKEQQIERCKNTINCLRECYIYHVKNVM